VEVHALAGTSMGAVIGALYAAGYRADALLELARAVRWRDLIDLSLHGGLLKGDKLGALLSEHLPETFDGLERPLAVTCTDIESGEEVVFTDGDLITAVRASCCFPGAFEPVVFEGRTLADGGICNNLPVDALALMRVSYAIASDVTPARAEHLVSEEDDDRSWWERMRATVTLETRSPWAAVTFRATDIMMRLLVDAQYVHHPADLRIEHELRRYRLESFRDLDAIVEEGERVAEAALASAGDSVPKRPQRRR
jgi:NTE family protein